jgi:hypothetical protein
MFTAVFTDIPDTSRLSTKTNVSTMVIMHGNPYTYVIIKKTKVPDRVLPDRRIRTLRTSKGLTQQEPGQQADVDTNSSEKLSEGT